MKISVTDSDIKTGIPSGLYNPVAVSLERSTGRKWFVWTNFVAIEIEPPCRDLPLPPDAVAHLDDFITSGKMQPFEFDMEIPPRREFGTWHFPDLPEDMRTENGWLVTNAAVSA